MSSVSKGFRDHVSAVYCLCVYCVVYCGHVLANYAALMPGNSKLYNNDIKLPTCLPLQVATKTAIVTPRWSGLVSTPRDKHLPPGSRHKKYNIKRDSPRSRGTGTKDDLRVCKFDVKFKLKNAMYPNIGISEHLSILASSTNPTDAIGTVSPTGLAFEPQDFQDFIFNRKL